MKKNHKNTTGKWREEWPVMGYEDRKARRKAWRAMRKQMNTERRQEAADDSLVEE